MKGVLKWFGYLLTIISLYVIGALLYGTITDFQPEEIIKLEMDADVGDKINMEDTLSVLSWNIGYAGLGEEADFFFDYSSFFSGGMDVNPEERYVKKNLAGIKKILKSQKRDFIMLQEVDRDSKRSYYKDQYEDIFNELNCSSKSFATNFSVDYIPIPVCEPWNVMGQVQAGIASFTTYTPLSSTRYQLPGEYDWPTRIFQLDRCILVQRFQTSDHKEFVLINLHFSAYDEGGFMKKQQLSYLEALISKEYERGNYVLAGGDWNQTPEKLREISTLTPEWSIVNHENVPTCRSTAYPYDKMKSQVKQIDYFLVSPNLKVINNTTLSSDFEYSDHAPVEMTFTMG